jgi:hypothetical protein
MGYKMFKVHEEAQSSVVAYTKTNANLVCVCVCVRVLGANIIENEAWIFYIFLSRFLPPILK